MAKNKLSQAQKEKVRLLTPIVQKWNEIHEDHWKVAPFITESGRSNTVDVLSRPVAYNIHGILMTYIAGICNSYGWTWAVYFDDENGLHVSI